MSKRYAKTHEWIEPQGYNWRVGISNYAQEQLGDIVYVQLPEVGDAITATIDFMEIESVKVASDIHAPASGSVVAVNAALRDNPSLVNDAAEGDGWLADITVSDISDLDDLMDAAAYQEYIKTLPDS